LRRPHQLGIFSQYFSIKEHDHMPAFSVAIDGKSIATVCMDEYNVIDVRVGGTQLDEDIARLELSGGSFPEQGKSTHLTWVNELPLRAGQVVTISFLEHAQTSHAGKTTEELFPDDASFKETSFKPYSEIISELRAKPKLHSTYSFRLESSTGTVFEGETKSDDFGFALSVLWDWLSPARAKVSLHTYTLDSLEARGPVRDLLYERISFGDSIRFKVIA
jgi:hypothetical protein